ncbi:hypothetical protein JXB28_05760 [Candidatus Woesearchaeota archaeon]|nr:hypothetical protein [Candidatus Woesearchaeota archaeon]
MDYKKIIGAVGLVAIISSPGIAGRAASQEIFQTYVIEQDITEKMSEKEKHYFALSQAFSDADLVFKGRCVDVATAYCSAVRDVCTNYVFESDTFYKHPAIEGFRKDPVKHKLSLFYDVRLPDITITRQERAIMDGGSNGGLYEPTSTGIMIGDELIVFAEKKDLANDEYFIRHYCQASKNNNKVLDEIVKGKEKSKVLNKIK